MNMPRGISSSGDMITSDGVDVNVLWADYENAIGLLNQQKGTLKTLLSYPTQSVADLVPQVGTIEDFEDATEFGVPVSIRPAAGLSVAYNFKWRDLAWRSTWRFLRTADRQQVDSMLNLVIASDANQTYRAVLGALFNSAQRLNPEGRIVYPLYNNDGTVPPEYNGIVHLGTHTHYLASGAATVDGVDLKDLIVHVRHHGYADAPGTQLLILANPAEMDVVRGFKAGIGTPASPFDFIPARGSDAFLSTAAIIGDQPPANFGQLKIDGSFGPAWVSESALIPAGYLLAVVSDGDNGILNPVGFREHAQPSLRGMLPVGGPTETYPLVDSYFTRGFGTGVRHRGAAAIMKITAGAYDVPAPYTKVVA